MTSRPETQMGDQVIYISYPLKFQLVLVTINRHQILTGVPIAPDYNVNYSLFNLKGAKSKVTNNGI